MIVVEIYSYESGIRCVDKAEYPDYETWEKDKMLLKISGKWVGDKTYEICMADFNELTPTQRNNLPFKADFDRDAYINNGAPRSPFI